MSEDPFNGFYDNSVLFNPGGLAVCEVELLPTGSIDSRVLASLLIRFRKLEVMLRNQGQRAVSPCLKALHVNEGRVTALVQTGEVILKIALRKNARFTGEEDWVILGDALKIQD